MDILLLYLFTRLNAMHALLVILILGCGAMVFFVSLQLDFVSGAQEAAYRRYRSRALIAAVVLGVVMVLIPTQRDAAIILAGWGIIEVAKSETAGRLASKSVQLIEQTLDGYLKPKEGK